MAPQVAQLGAFNGKADLNRALLVSVVIPAYNEVATIEEVVRRVRAVEVEKEIIIVDDGSTDGTRQVLERIGAEQPDARLRIFFQPQNCGKGAALRRGFQEAQGDVVLIQDADLELDPQEYYKLLGPIQAGTADVVYGSRFLTGTPEGISSLYLLGNKVLTIVSNLCTGLSLTDVWTGYKVFRREILHQVALRENRFGFEPEVTAQLAKLKCRIVELPVSYSCRTREEGKKIGWKDACRGIWCTIRCALFR